MTTFRSGSQRQWWFRWSDMWRVPTSWRNPLASPGGSSRPSKYHPSINHGVGVHRASAMPGTWRIDGTSEGVVVHGEVDLDTASEFEAQASEAVMLSTAGTFLIDLSDVTFLDSAGLQALLRVLEIRVLDLRDGQRIIVQPSRQVFTLLHLSGLMNGTLPNVLVREPEPD
ncbi:MAG TPA: STAS domain-containing protein [Actinomycetota bacterium]|nr:STAS domain-containing protein [Actinomycetota bacterium]